MYGVAASDSSAGGSTAGLIGDSSAEKLDYTQISEIDSQIEENNRKKENLEARREQVAQAAQDCRKDGDYAGAAQFSSERMQLTEDISNLDKENESLQTQKEELLKEQEEAMKNINVSNLTIMAGNVKLEGKENNQDNNADNNQPIKTVDNDTDSENKGDDDYDFDLIEGKESLKDKILRGITVARDTGFVSDVKDLGNEAYKGFNSIRDTFYAPTAPSTKDWQQTAGLRDERAKASAERRKERVEKSENKFVKDESNQQFMFENMKIDGIPVMDYYKSMYPDKSDTYVREKAQDRVEKELEKMKGYAVYGMNAEQAYPLYKDQKQFGFTKEEAIRNRVGFEKFDANIDNVNFINDKYKEQGIHVTSVSEVVPNAKEYYANGHRNIKDVLDINYLQQKLDVSYQKAMQIDSALRKKGKLECSPQKANETDKEYKVRQDMYAKINDMYKNKK